MSLLELITKASANREPSGPYSQHPIILNPDEAFSSLKPKLENPDPNLLVSPATGWQFSPIDSQVIELTNKLCTKLKRKLKDTSGFEKGEFLGVLKSFLEKFRERVGVSLGVDASDEGYVSSLVREVGPFVGRDAAGLVLEACIRLEVWDLVEVLIVNGIVGHSCYSMLITSLVEKKRSGLVCAAIKHARDFGLSELLAILKYLLRPTKDAYLAMADVRKEWESQGLLAIEKVRDKKLSSKKSRLAKDASVLLMVACDGFLTNELCLHYLLASPNVDDVILSSCIGKLNEKEMMNLVSYLGKWLKKYEMFPQAIPCPEAASMLGLKACDSVPKLEDVVRWLGLVLDESFTSVVLHTEFHEELEALRNVVDLLAAEAKGCCVISNIIENSRTQADLEQ